MRLNARPRKCLLPLGVTLTILAACQGGKYLEDFVAEPTRTTLSFYPPEQVTAGNEDNFAPDLSPNGEFVVYTSDRKGNKDIWEKRTLGGLGRQITYHSADDFSPVISPNGQRVAFVSRRADAAGDIHVIDLGFSWSALIGKAEGDTSAISSPLTEDTNPSWFPSSDRLVFAARNPGDKVPSLLTAHLDDLRPIPLGDVHGDQPSVAPDGKMIAFVRDGAIFIYHEDTDKTDQVTAGGELQDGQPRFTPDGKSLVFIRYADDTNQDGKLNGDDRPTIWRLDLASQLSQKIKENYLLTPLTAATFSAFSPQFRGPFLYMALQTNEGLNIFRLPEFGQIKPGKDLDEVRQQFDQQTDYYEKTFVLRRAEAAFATSQQADLAAETAAMELAWVVQNGRRTEATWVQAKLKANFPERRDLVALADLAMKSLDLGPLLYPKYKDDLTGDQTTKLASLNSQVEGIIQPFLGNETAAKRVRGQGLLLRAQILAAQRRFFDANKMLTDIQAAYPDDRRLTAESAYYGAVILPATSDIDAAVRALREVARQYPDNRDVALRASQAAVGLVESRPDRLEALAALRTDAKGVPIMPALAHRRISDLFMAQGKVAVAANELRQIVDLYPESPEIVLESAERLAVLEEKAERYDSAEAMLNRLNAAMANNLPEHKAQARRLLIEFLLNRGESLLKLKVAAAALSEYEKVIALDPLNVPAHRGKIDAAFQSHTLEGLKEQYAADAAAHPQSAERLYFLGYAQSYDVDLADSPSARLAAIDTCIDTVEAARQLNAQILQVHATLGWLYMQKNFTSHEYYREGGVVAKARWRAGLVKDFFGAGEPDYREMAIDSFQNAYFLSRPESLERAGLAQDLGQAYYALKNYQKSLAYYMQRIKALAVIPMRDGRAEAILLDRAGRSAFQIDELELAESLQRNALTAWENVNNDTRIAYAVDALALTLRERGKYKDALTLYDRLERIEQRLGARENRVGTLSNLGYCSYMDGQYIQALAYFDGAESELRGVQVTREGDGDAGDVKTSDAIKVDLGGGASAAKGFDLFARQVLILTFRAKVYEKLDRYDLALATYEAKLRLLKDAQKDGRKLDEDISVLENNLGEQRLAGGYHQQAREAFNAAEVSAKPLRPDGQSYKSSGEVLNSINRARVELRLASLGLLRQEELDKEVKDLEQTADGLRPVFTEGGKSQGKPLAQLLALSASLRGTKAAPGDDAHLKANLDESLAIMRKIEAPKDALGGTLLAYKNSVGATASDASVTGLMTDFKKQALANPALEWKVRAGEGDYDKAFEALDRFVAGGGTLRSPTDRLTAREIFERLLDEDVAPQDQGRLALLLRRFTLMRHLDMLQRAGVDKGRATHLLGLQETTKVQAILGDDDAVLMAHVSLKGRAHLFLQDKKGLVATVAQVPSKRLNADLLSQIIANSPLASALPKVGGRLYIVPSGELFDLAWEKMLIGGQPLGQRNVVAYLAAFDLLPDLYAKRKLPKSSMGHIGGQASTDDIKAANAARDYSEISLNGEAALAPRLYGLNLVHADAPLWLNDVEPGVSVLAAHAATGSTAYLDDMTLKQLAAANLPSTAALIFANVQRDNLDLAESGESQDGWAFLSLAAAAAGVPSVYIVERPSTALGLAGAPAAPPMVTADPKADWSAFYLGLADKGIGEAAMGAHLPGRLLGYAGIPAAEELGYAKAHLDKAMDEAEDAKADQDYDGAASAFKRALAFAKRTGQEKVEDKVLGSLVGVLNAKRDYEGALFFKKKILTKLRPAAKGSEKDDDADPVVYANGLMDAVVLAVKSEKFPEAESLLSEAEAIFSAEKETLSLGKVWQYRAINLEGQKKYEETIEAYTKSYAIFAKVRPEDGAAQLLNIGNVYLNRLSNYAMALEYYDRAAAEFKKLGKQELYVPVLIDKANTQVMIGDLQTAISVLEREVIPTIDREKQRVLWVRASQTLANAYFRAGLFQEASELNDRILVEVEKIQPKAARADRQLDAIALRAYIAAKLGHYKESFEEYRRAIALATQYNNKGQIALLYNNYGFWAREYGAVDQSIEFFNVALKIDTELKSRSAIAFDNRNMGLSIILKGDFNRAQDLLSQALKDSEALHLVYNTAYCYFGLGDLAMRQEKWAEAEGFFRKALDVSIKGYMQDFVWRAYAGVGGALLRQKKGAPAQESLAKAIALVEQLRAGLKSEPSRNAFYSDVGVQEVYEAYAEALMEQGQVEAAWSASERSRGRAFIDALGTQKIRFARTESAELMSTEKDRKADVEAVERRISQVVNDPKGAPSLEKDLQAAQSRYDALIEQMHAVDRQLAEFVKVEAISSAELTKLLGGETALVEYQVTPDHLLIWVLQNGQIHGKSVAVAKRDLEARVRDFRLLMENFSSPEYLGKELADILLAPVKEFLGNAQRLAIVPHGVLHFLPFAALPVEGDDVLIDRFPLYYLESATFARYTHGKSPHHYDANTRILALANPLTEENLAPLPFAGKEIDVIQRYFPQITGEEGAAATAASVSGATDQYDVIHIASHGEFKPSAPAQSRLLLAPLNGQSGNLSVDRIFGMTTKADMVTLSACESGMGRLSAGDEIIGMDRAFFYAGANTVVSSLWRISDVASAVTMKRFYRYLGEGQDKAEAMRQAQMVVRKYFKHPAYWSAFRVLGGYR